MAERAGMIEREDIPEREDVIEIGEREDVIEIGEREETEETEDEPISEKRFVIEDISTLNLEDLDLEEIEKHVNKTGGVFKFEREGSKKTGEG